MTIDDARKFYSQLIENAQSQNRKKIKGGTYYERHHIIPRSLGGLDIKENIVLLTGREHFEAHQFLVKMYQSGSDEWRKMAYACHKMTHGLQKSKYDITIDEFEFVREIASLAAHRKKVSRRY